MFNLVEITTYDKLIHQGIFFRPQKAGKRALLWVHGLTSTFYANASLLNEFTKLCEKQGFGYASFNNRGHDLLASMRKVDKRKTKGYTHVNGGAGYENFKASIYDIDAGISFLVSQGFSEIILIGSSTGANKVCYYSGSKKDSRVAGVILVSPISDRLTPDFDPQIVKQTLAAMENLVKEGKGDELQFGYHFFPLTPKRIISLMKPNTLEDQFDYGEEKPKLTYFKRIKKPLLLLFGSSDEYIDRPVEKIVSVYDKFARSKNYLSVIIPNALHSYGGDEVKLTETIISWVITI